MRRTRGVLGGLFTAALVALAGGCASPPLAATPLEPGGHPVALAADPSGCAVAVGYVDNGYQLHPEIWQSDDCSHFAGRPIPDPCPPGCEIPGDDRTFMKGVAALPTGGFLGVGYTEERTDELPAEMEILRSPDGVNWDDVTGPTPLSDQHYGEDVVVTQTGDVLVLGFDAGPRVWRSSDLAAWSTVELPSGGEPDAIAQAADGTLVVVGRISRTGDARDADAAAWVSTDDGRSWTAAPPEGPLTPTLGAAEALFDVIPLVDGGWMAVGRVADRPAVWRSGDGLAWTADDTGWAPAGSGISAVAQGDLGLLVAGSVRTDGVTQPTAWLSTDGGTTWAERRIDGRGFVTSALASAQGFVLVGGDSYRPGWATLLVP